MAVAKNEKWRNFLHEECHKVQEKHSGNHFGLFLSLGVVLRKRSDNRPLTPRLPLEGCRGNVATLGLLAGSLSVAKIHNQFADVKFISILHFLFQSSEGRRGNHCQGGGEGEAQRLPGIKMPPLGQAARRKRIQEAFGGEIKVISERQLPTWRNIVLGLEKT